jgi:hypothetical protein
VDGVSGEVLYPTLAMNLFGLQDAALQEACFRADNDWILEYCSVAPDRLFGCPVSPPTTLIMGYAGAVVEELGDVLWYLTAVAARGGLGLETIMADAVDSSEQLVARHVGPAGALA